MALGTLEVELLLIILEYVDEESPNTTISASLVNKHFYAIARRTRYRRQTLNITESGQSRISQLSAQPEALRSIRHLTVEGRPRSKTIALDEIQSLTKFVQVLTSLRSLVWRYAGPIPLEILDTLHHYQPRAKLKVYNWTREVDDADHNDPAEIALANSPALTVFQASIWNGPDLREPACKRIIANAPNLQYASITTGTSGCIVRVLSTAEKAQLAEKEELFYTHKQPSRSLKALTLDGYGLSRLNIERWGRFIDFSKLESLKCSRGFVPDKSYFELAPELLTSLKHVSLNFSYNRDVDVAAAADNYLATCSPIQTLSLWSWMGVISLTTILKHGPTLEILQLHERESMDLDVPRSVLKAPDVADIRRACPRLREFTMDINREAQAWEEERNNQAIYDELAQFSLDKLQLYFNLGIAAQISTANRAMFAFWPSESNSAENDNGILPAKQVTQNSPTAKELAMLPLRTAEDTICEAQSIWRRVFGRRRTGARALDIKIGEWERKTGIGYPANWMLWETENRSYLKLRPHERDDMLDQVVVTCQGGLQEKISNRRALV